MATPIQSYSSNREWTRIKNSDDPQVKLLVIDDDFEDFFSLRRKLLSSDGHGYEIVHVDNYDDGIQELERSSYDAVLIDYFIGERSGTEIFDTFDNAAPKMPVIVLTGSDDSDVERAALKAGAFDFLDKNSLTSETLIRSINFALKRFEIEKDILEKQERLRRACENAEAAHFSKSEFLEFLGNEVKTPLNAILGFSQAMNENSLAERMPEVCQQYTKIIHSSGLQLHKLIEDLLDLSTTDAESFDTRSRRFKRYRTWIIDRDEVRDKIETDRE